MFWPQDLIFLTALLIISALSLFLFTAVAGRVWCGYACPQTVYTEMFMWIERKIEGDRTRRMQLDKAPWSGRKLALKASKHGAWLAIALWTGFTFVGYFTPIKDSGQLSCHTIAKCMANLLDPVLCRRDVRQCRLPARAGLQIHVPVRQISERDVRLRYADRHL